MWEVPGSNPGRPIGGIMMEKTCSNRGYKGLRRPRCGKGWGCVRCWTIYNKRRYAKTAQFDRHWSELKDEAPDWFEIEDESELKELCWSFFMRGLELKLGPAPKMLA
jgi:glycine/D-amino acid oxidase-like deaminating enzyme